MTLNGHSTEYWHGLADGRLQCDVCPRYCKLRAGQRGLCFVRGRAADEIVLTSYGRSSGFCIDPVEKKPLNHFLPGTPVLSFGTAGCNLACKFCQNWDMTKSRDFDRLQESAAPHAIADAALANGCRSVAYTYNDPIIFLEYAIDVADACRERGIRSIAVTSGYITAEPRRALFAHMDAANIDLKAFTDRFYWKICGAHLEPVLDTLRYLHTETDTWIELTNLLIPGENDSSAEIDRMTKWIAEYLGPEVPLHFTAFHPDWKMRDTPPTPHATLSRARDIARQNGLHHVYTGNVHDPVGSSTYCSGCGALLIERDGYELSTWNIECDNSQAVCARCQTIVPGIFEDRPGSWGARRKPVHIVAPAEDELPVPLRRDPAALTPGRPE
jgi:pyruvate formate lyase activating enzyme